KMTAVAACMDACRGLPWATCSVVVKSEVDNSPNCRQRSSSSQSAVVEQTTPQIGNDLVINVAPQNKVSINSPTLNESITTVITSGQIVLSAQKLQPSSGDRMSHFNILKDFRITLNDIPFCFASNK